MKTAFGLLLLLFSGVSCIGTPLPVTKGFVAIHDAVAPEYAEYVANDPALTPLARRIKLETVKSWGKLAESVRDDVQVVGQ